MRSHLEFRSGALRDPPHVRPGGETVARLLTTALPAHGYRIERMVAEDWGWCVKIAQDCFPLWIGCGAYAEYPDGHLCFITPSRPRIWRWLRRIDTRETVERLADALEACVRQSGVAHHLRWWSDEEVRAG
ncbi:hypothetical protein ACFOKF_18540 [Sphingobium rhizovicinum]|uniref:Uncharacterized protein n=1 Tax=Sphingobium rhizovicinum TaxID=432308 RepID=A0ABV7NL49_9SPHN